MDTGKSIQAFDIQDVSGGCNYSDDITALTKNQSPDSMNVEFFNGRTRKRFGEKSFTTPPSGQGGIDTYTKLMLHADGTDGSTTFTDSETTPKTVTANGNARISTSQSKFGGASGLFGSPGFVDSSTSLLLHMDGVDGSTTFTDSSSSVKAVTANGTAQIDTAQSKFGGASGLFDGVGAYLTTPSSSDFDMGSGNFTIDFWAKQNVAGTTQAFITRGVGAGFSQLWMYMGADNKINIIMQSAAMSATIGYYITTNAVTLTDNFHHIALVRNGTNIYLFLDGTSQALTVDTAIGSTALDTGDTALTIGKTTSGASFYFNGWLDEMRVSKGIARWTTNFTVPTLAYSTGDYLTTPSHADFDFGTGDFTVDFWLRQNLGGSTQFLFTRAFNSFANYVMYVSIDSSSRIFFLSEKHGGGENANYNTTAGVTLNDAFHHIALVRNSANFYIFVDGVSQSLTTTTAIGSNSIESGDSLLYVGVFGAATLSNYFNGNLDEVRISKGIARWTTNFTPPSLAYDTFSASVVPVGFSLVDFSNTTGYHQQVTHLGQTVYAYDRVTSTKVTLRSGAPYTRSYNAKVSSYLVQTYNDYSAPYYWDGLATSLALLSANAPSFKRVIEFQGYLIGMNISSAKTRCYYQPITNILGGGAAYTDYFTLTPSPNDDEISDPFLLNGRLYVGTKYGIFRVSFVGGVTVFEFKQVISDTGIVPCTLQTIITKQFGQVALFLGTDKRVYMFDGANVKAISDLFYYHNEDTPISLDLIDDNYKENSFAVYDSSVKIYRLFVTKKSQSKNYYCLNIDVDTFAYYPFDNMQFSSGCIGYDRLLKPYLICTDYLGKLHKLFIDVNTDNGSAINEYYTSPLVSVKTQLMKQAETIDVSFIPSSNAKLNVYLRIDYRRQWELFDSLPLADVKDKFLGDSFVLNSSPLGSVRSVRYSQISLSTSFNCLQFKLVSDTPTARRWEIFDINTNQTVLKFGKAEAMR